MSKLPLTIALTKGRILKETLPLFAAIGIEPLEDIQQSRKLTISTNQPHIQWVILRGSDVPTYVAHGAADIGVAGKDVLLETGSNDLYEPLDLQIARCRLMTAGLPNQPPLKRQLRVATKFVTIAKQYFAKQAIPADIIKLHGALELAPLMGLADLIVDIVDTGNTLKANGLQALDLIASISSRLVVNKVAMKCKHQTIAPLIEQLRGVLEPV
jgi:ATP phosphoribosyltransferase